MLKTKIKKAVSRFLASATALAMAVTLLPLTAAAAGDNVSGRAADDNSPIQLTKTAKLQADGTYTIDLEAYVTGEIITQVERKNKPTDIVLVLDQSGSMAWSMSGLPNDSYSEAGTLSNADAYAGSYYYKIGEKYFPVTVKYASTGSVEKYVDSAGNEYDESQVATTWIDNDGDEKEAYGPYLKSSLTAVYRDKSGIYYYYVPNGKTTFLGSNAVASGIDQTRLRNNLRDNYVGFTVQFDNSDYTAAIYTQLTPVYAHTYEYYYTDDEGNVIALPAVGTSNNDNCPYTLYKRGDQNGKRLDVLKYAVEKFVAGVEADAKTNEIDHRIAIVGFSSESDNNNTEILTGVQITKTKGSNNSTNVYYPDGNAYNGVQYNSTGYTDATGKALQSVTDESGKANIAAGINALTAHGATRSDLGMQMAEDILSARTDKSRDAIVIFFTDGEPTSSSDFDKEVAADTINIAKELKIGEKVSVAKQDKDTPGGQPTGEKLGYTASVYSVAVYEGAGPNGSANINGSGATRINDFLHMVSSNYPNARGENQGNRGWEYFREAGSNKGYYMVADNAARLANIFATITNNIHQSITTVNLGTEAVLRDVISDSFELPTGYDKSSITVQTADYQGDGNWSAAENFEAAAISISENTIDISNFDYSGNVVTEAVNGNPAGGKKLIVTIPGVLAKDEAATGAAVFTNTADSGVYNTVEGEFTRIKAFERPTVLIGKKAYVLDYGKEAVLEQKGEMIHLSDAMSKFTTAVPSLTKTYGKATLGADALSYEPTTMNWNGYDTFYTFEGTTDYTWTQRNVLPANSVYYEDDFVTESNSGRVGIEYSKDGWEVIGTAGENTQTIDDEAYGWETSYEDDLTYSDGTAHVSDTVGATATFTFTGTNVDIYSKTDMTSGWIKASLYTGTEVKAAALTKVLYVDGLAESNQETGYYQIPTVSLGLKDEDGAWIHGTYTVKLTVMAARENPERSTYYLDAIRVYNPIQNLEGTDAVVDDAYADAEESNAYFLSVRDILIDSASFDSEAEGVTGAVFIDKTADETGTVTNDVGTYEDYGPKNEVYLAAGQKIAFQVSGDGIYSLGLKAPSGTATTANVTNGEGYTPISIGTASDMYYRINPNPDGYVVIENAGGALLSITQLRITCEETAMYSLSIDSMPMLMSYVSEFDTLSEVSGDLEETPEEETPDLDTPAEGETEGNESGDVEITNPPEEEKPAAGNSIQKLIARIFESLRGWFR